MVKKFQINLSNKLFYTLVVIGIISVFGIGVYALTPGTAPNPGHLISNVAPPLGCEDGQYLKWDGSAWSCAVVSGGSVSMGLYGRCEAVESGGNKYCNPTLTGSNPLSPATCVGVTAATYSGYCACPSGYTLIVTGAGYGKINHSCYKI